jgi:LuxR family transcriptional regulator, maltose regulon positive regulatory protein
VIETYRSFARAAERSRQAIELARRHGWTDEPTAGTAYVMLGAVLAGQGRAEEAEPWVQRAERTPRAETELAAGAVVHHVRGVLELVCGRYQDALAAFQAAERLAGNLATPRRPVERNRRSSRSAEARSGSCATCRPTCQPRRSRMSCMSRGTRSELT